MSKQIEKIVTGDGCHSLYVPALDENYHSTHGALNEALHVFIQNGLNETKEEVAILEVGFGTGLNALLTGIEAQNQERKVTYTGLETFPLDKKLISELNYPKLVTAGNASELFSKIHDSSWEEKVTIHDFFTVKKMQKGVQDIHFANQFDLIYFDAFGPRKQPEMWTVEVFGKMYQALKPNGFLVTYCAQGQVKRNMKEVGFSVQALPGPPGKREMTKALKIA